MIRKLRRSAGKVLAAYSRIWRSVEGPELEPRFWHSHFLSYRTGAPILKRLGHHLRGLILDIGSGTGHGARYLEPDNTSYFPTDLPTGRDPDDRMISRQALTPKVYCSVYTLPFPENCFDGALLFSLLEHLSNPPLALDELRRVLKGGALVLVAVPFAFPLHDAPHDYRRWTIPGLELELKNARYEVLEALPCGGALTSLAMNMHLAIRYH
jgi:SAM-dependent methyltransferase